MLGGCGAAAEGKDGLRNEIRSLKEEIARLFELEKSKADEKPLEISNLLDEDHGRYLYDIEIQDDRIRCDGFQDWRYIAHISPDGSRLFIHPH